MKKTHVLAGTVALLLLTQGSFGHETGVKELGRRVVRKIASMKQQQIPQVEFAHAAQLDENLIQSIMKYLETIPQAKPVLNNLPENITYIFSSKTPGIASFDSTDNTITISPNGLNLNDPQDRFALYQTLIHELRHANQKKEGLYYDDLINASFGQTFRVAKLMEMETRLFDAIIENELLKREEFEGCAPSLDAIYYKQELKRANNDVAKANTNFVRSYWENTKNTPWIDNVVRENINKHYFFYVEQAYHHALLMHNPQMKQASSNRTTPVQAAEAYGKRMSLKGMESKVFLENGFDEAITTDNFRDGITILYHDGTKYLHLTPTENPFVDMAIFFKDNQPDRYFLRNSITKEMQPIEIAGDAPSKRDLERSKNKARRKPSGRNIGDASGGPSGECPAQSEGK